MQSPQSASKGLEAIDSTAKITLAVIIMVALIVAITGLLDQGLSDFLSVASTGEEGVIPKYR
ncbi:MAG: hypothetical protein H8Z69_03010 [Nanohaloarchaea archaeon]|nr:hypothetical protein [Candidatus Nanohaloarchaea archaeon]